MHFIDNPMVDCGVVNLLLMGATVQVSALLYFSFDEYMHVSDSYNIISEVACYTFVKNCDSTTNVETSQTLILERSYCSYSSPTTS